MTLTELAALEAVLDRMTPADRELVAPRVLPAWRRREHRFAARDALLRDARRRLFPGPRTVAARRLSRALGAYAIAGWRWERERGLPADANERHSANFAILKANGGRPLGWRRIADILCNNR